MWQSKTIFSILTNNQPDDPKASLLLTSVRRQSFTIKSQNWYFAPKHLCKTLLCPFGASNHFVWNGPKGSRWAQRGPKWSKRLRLTILVPFGPFWTTLERWQACHVWPFLGHSQSWTVNPRVKKRFNATSPMCGLLVEPQNIPFRT